MSLAATNSHPSRSSLKYGKSKTPHKASQFVLSSPVTNAVKQTKNLSTHLNTTHQLRVAKQAQRQDPIVTVAGNKKLPKQISASRVTQANTGSYRAPIQSFLAQANVSVAPSRTTPNVYFRLLHGIAGPKIDKSYSVAKKSFDLLK